MWPQGPRGGGYGQDTYTTPSGIALNASYIRYLRRILPAATRLRMTGQMRPVVVVVDGKAVGVLMPVAQ